MTPAVTGTVREVMLTVTGEETYADGHTDSMKTRSRAVHEKVFEAEGCGAGEEARIAHVFRYRETDLQSGAVTESVIGFAGAGGSMERTGAVSTKMRFAPGEETECVYDTPFGSIPMTISTRLVAMREVGDNFHARIRYRLTPAGGDPVECAVTVRAEPAGRSNEQ